MAFPIAFSMDELLQNVLSQRKSRRDLITEYEKWLKQMERTHSENLHCHIKTNNGFDHKEISQDNNLQLKDRISIANLEIDKVHSGKFLLCRVIRRCAKMNALFTLI